MGKLLSNEPNVKELGISELSYPQANETAKVAGQRYAVEIYNGKHLMTVVTVMAKDMQEASVKARSEFFADIHAKVKRAYN